MKIEIVDKINMDFNDIEKTEEMIKFEKETGKKAIWRGVVTKEFQKWKKGLKIYDREGVRWTIYVNADTDKKWKDFLSKIKVQITNYSITQLGKEAINLLIEFSKKLEEMGKNYDYQFIKKYVNDFSEVSSVLSKSEIREDFIQSITPLKLSIPLMRKNIRNPDELITLIETAQEAIKKFDKVFDFYFEEPKLKRFVTYYDVLHIEDDKLTREAVKFFFEMNNYTICSVEKAKMGLNELKNITPKLIIIDIGLPGKLRGDSLCKLLKAKEEYKKIPIILLTAKSTEKDKENLKTETGADDVILKSQLNTLDDLNKLLKYLES